MTLKKKMVCCIMAGIMTVSFSVPANASDVSAAERRARQLEQQKKDAEADKSSLASQLEKIVSDMKKSEEKMEKKEAEIAKAEEDLLAAKIEEDNQYNGMKKRIKYMYEHGSTEFIEILFASKNISEFLNKADYITKLSEYDKDMLVEFQKVVKEVEEKEKELQKEYDQLAVLQKDLSGKQVKVESLLKEKQSELASIESEMGEVQTLLANAKEAERRRQEAAQAQKPKPTPNPGKPSGGNNGSSSGNGGGSVVSGNGQFTHPCPGARQTSYFGEIRQGIGDTRPHKGIDYAAPAGTPIYAAAAGRVLIAGYSNSAGNWVVISHGNGLTTKYMHMYTTPYVSVGQQVSKGQNIGGVGTTGQSTGNHLHFQAELNGVPVDPKNYM